VAPSRDEVVRQLDRLLASEAFANTERGRRFLRYVVDRTLAGEGDQLKEFVIGVDVFDRGDEYDPRIDSIVRVEAGRLRSKLDHYYSRATDDDSVVIRMARGSYVPSFGYRAPGQGGTASLLPDATRPGRPIRVAALAGLAAAVVAAFVVWSFRSSVDAVPAAERPSTASASRVSVVVLPFEHFASEREVQLLAARFTDGLTGELARIEHVAVVSRTTAARVDTGSQTLREIARALDAQVVVEGSVLLEGTRVDADVRIVDTVRDRKSWSRRFTADVSELRELQQRVAADVGAFLAPR
jgi:TolB-like protein